MNSKARAGSATAGQANDGGEFGVSHSAHKTTMVIAAIIVVFLYLAACAPLSIYNAVVRDDAGGVLLKADLDYGKVSRQKLDVYGPANKHSSTPVVVVIYGGSWNSGRKKDYAFLGKALASRGFVAMDTDYRLGPNVRFPIFVEIAPVQWFGPKNMRQNSEVIPPPLCARAFRGRL